MAISDKTKHRNLIIISIILIVFSMISFTIKGDQGTHFGWATLCEDNDFILGCTNNVPNVSFLMIGLLLAIAVILYFPVPNHITNLKNNLCLLVISIGFFIWFKVNLFMNEKNDGFLDNSISKIQTSESVTTEVFRLDPGSWALYSGLLLILSYLIRQGFWSNSSRSEKSILVGFALLLASTTSDPINYPGKYNASWRYLCSESQVDGGCLSTIPIILIAAIVLSGISLLLILQRNKFSNFQAFSNWSAIIAGILSFILIIFVNSEISRINKNFTDLGDDPELNFRALQADEGLGIWLIVLGSALLLIGGISRFEKVHSTFEKQVEEPFHRKYPYGRKSPSLNNLTFILLLVLILYTTFTQQAVDSGARVFIVIQVISLIGIFAIMSVSLNLHTGYTGLVNFGVIFFAAIGAISVSLLSCDRGDRGFDGLHPMQAMIIGIVLSGIIGYLIAYPTIKLRNDYFAIVTISIGEILRNMVKVDKNLRCNQQESNLVDRPGITGYERYGEKWWKGDRELQIGIPNLDLRLFEIPEVEFFTLNFSFIKGTRIGWLPNFPPFSNFENWWNEQFAVNELGYSFLLMIYILIGLILTMVIASWIVNSPYGRTLKTIREDQDVVESYGYNVFRYKAIILAVGAAIAALAGGLWAWFLGTIFSNFLDPVRSTFFVWAAFIIGGKGNNKGMIVGASIIILMDQTFRNLSGINRVTEADTFLDSLDSIFRFIVVDIGGWWFGAASYEVTFQNETGVLVNVNTLQLAIIGFIIMFLLLRSQDGLLPEIPYRPKVPEKFKDKLNIDHQAEFTQSKEMNTRTEKSNIESGGAE